MVLSCCLNLPLLPSKPLVLAPPPAPLNSGGGRYSARLEPANSLNEVQTRLYVQLDSNRRRHRMRHHRHRGQRRHQHHSSVPLRRQFKGQYEHLCDTVTSTVHLNTPLEEFNPPFYVEKRCKYLVDLSPSSSSLTSHTTFTDHHSIPSSLPFRSAQDHTIQVSHFL